MNKGGVNTGAGHLIKNHIKKLYCYISGFSLNNKLIISYVLVIAVPIISFAIYTFSVYRSNIELELMKENEYKLQKARANIEKNFNIFRKSYYSVVSNRSFIKFLSTYDKSRVRELVEFHNEQVKNIISITDVNPILYSIRFFTNNRHVPEIWPILFSMERVKECYWYYDVVEADFKEVWLFNHDDIRYGQNNKTEKVISLYHEIKDDYGESLGVLEINMLTKAFVDDAFNDITDKSSMMCLKLDNGEFIACTNSSFFEFIEADRSELFYRLSKAEYNRKRGNYSININDSKIMVTYLYYGQPLNGYIILVSSNKETVDRINVIKGLMLLAVTGSIIILSIITFFITSILLKKIKLIIKTMRQVQNGKLNVEIPVWSNDEIGELAYHFRKMMTKINTLIDVVVKKETATKSAQIQALQSQINAHFIYNVLEGLKTMAEIQKNFDLSEGISTLGRMMRYTTDWKKKYVTVKDELDNIRDYVALMNIRYRNKILLHIDFEQRLMNHEMLKMTLQPIVENAIVHGLEPKKGHGTVNIKGYIEEEIFCIDIIDTGIGLNQEKLEQLNRHLRPDDSEKNSDIYGKKGAIGLKNITERIRLFYGQQYGITVCSVEKNYLKVTLRLPYKKGLLMQNEKGLIG